MQRFGDKRDWFCETRFGLFVHWGLYAISGWHEQEQLRRAISRPDYVKLIEQFNPTSFDPDAWLDLAEEAGMAYVCFTTKHHDGFCLWDTSETAFNVMKSPYGKDIVAVLAEACRRRKFPLCLYYSVVDWNHPNYPNQNRSHELAGPQAGDTPEIETYMRFLKAQVRELCTQYGEIHGFWWDQNHTGLRDPSVNDMIRSLQPQAVINNRGFDDGDFGTPERDYDNYVHALAAFEQPTEACQSVGVESWGYRQDEDYYQSKYLMQSIDNTLSKGGNYLLNVGPKADGSIPVQAEDILRTIGKWYHQVKSSWHNTEPATDMTENPDVLLTRKGNTVYVHLIKEPNSSCVVLKPVEALPHTAVLMNTGEAITVSVELLPTYYAEGKKYLRLSHLPTDELIDTVMVARLEFENDPS